METLSQISPQTSLQECSAMSNLYYGEIAAKMHANFFQSQDCVSEMDENVRYSHDDEHLFDVCSKSASVFSEVQKITGNAELPWDDVLDEYTNDVLDHLQTNDNIDELDMVSIASRSAQNYR